MIFPTTHRPKIDALSPRILARPTQEPTSKHWPLNLNLFLVLSLPATVALFVEVFSSDLKFLQKKLGPERRYTDGASSSLHIKATLKTVSNSFSSVRGLSLSAFPSLYWQSQRGRTTRLLYLASRCHQDSIPSSARMLQEHVRWWAQTLLAKAPLSLYRHGSCQKEASISSRPPSLHSRQLSLWPERRPWRRRKVAHAGIAQNVVVSRSSANYIT